MRRLDIFIVATLCIFACDKEEPATQPTATFDVTTVGIGPDCRLVLIEFDQSDKVRIKKLTDSDWLRYQAYNLDKTRFGDEGLALTVKVRNPLPSEIFPCTTVGPGYPWVTVVEADIKK